MKVYRTSYPLEIGKTCHALLTVFETTEECHVIEKYRSQKRNVKIEKKSDTTYHIKQKDSSFLDGGFLMSINQEKNVGNVFIMCIDKDKREKTYSELKNITKIQEIEVNEKELKNAAWAYKYLRTEVRSIFAEM